MSITLQQEAAKEIAEIAAHKFTPRELAAQKAAGLTPAQVRAINIRRARAAAARENSYTGLPAGASESGWQSAQFQLPQVTGAQPSVQLLPGELPYQTYQRITGQSWPGGESPQIASLLKQYGITGKPGSPEANIALQKALVGKGVADVPEKFGPDQQDLDLYQQGLTKVSKVPERVSEIEKLMTGFELPTLPSLVNTWQQLRTQYAVGTEEQELANVRNKIAGITNLYEAAITKEEERYAPISIIRRRQERLSRDMQIELSSFTRREATLVDALNQKNKTISDLMQLYQWDYQAARENYMTEFNMKFQVLQFLRGEEKEELNRRQANYTTLMNAAKDVIASGKATFKTLPSNMLSDINECETKLGLPRDFSKWLFKNIPIDKKVQAEGFSDDKSQYWILYKDGTVKTIETGLKPKVTGNVEEASRIFQVSDFIETKKGEDGFISAESYLEAYAKWADMKGTLSSFQERFPATKLMGSWEVERLPVAFREKVKETLTDEEQILVNRTQSAINKGEMSYEEAVEALPAWIMKHIKPPLY